jgi:predicted DNA-binding WGR domain protein
MAQFMHTDTAKKKHRFYSLQITPTLFGEWSLVREWGRIGSPGTVRLESYESYESYESEDQARAEEQGPVTSSVHFRPIFRT